MDKALRKYAPIFVIPTTAAFVIGFVIPFIEGLYLSFCRFTTVSNAKWTGLDNFKYALTDEAFRHSFVFTVSFAVVSIILINVGGLGLALLLTMPNLIGGIVLGYIWQILINCILSNVGKPLLALNSTAGYWGLIILMCWQQIGYMMIIYIAGLQNVPDDILEAAAIDGASPAKTFFRVKLPMIMPSITLFGTPSMQEQSINAPGSPSSPLQTMNFGDSLCAAT